MKPSLPERLFEALVPALVTLAIFVGLPLIDFQRGDERNTALYELEVAEPPPPPPPPPPLKTRRETRPNAPKPRLAEPPPLMPLKASLSLDLAMGPSVGDFELGFRIRDPEITIRPEDFIFEVDDLDTPPQPLSRISPMYPPRARIKGIEGKVSLEFVVDETGSVRDIEITHAIPPDLFDAAARRAVKRWRFKPGVKDGRPVPSRLRQTVKFALE
jgi:protein TonB